MTHCCVSKRVLHLKVFWSLKPALTAKQLLFQVGLDAADALLRPPDYTVPAAPVFRLTALSICWVLIFGQLTGFALRFPLPWPALLERLAAILAWFFLDLSLPTQLYFVMAWSRERSRSQLLFQYM